MNRFILKKITQIKKKYINNIYIFLLKFCLKVSLSQLCLCTRFRASWVRKSCDGLALKKSTRPRPLPDSKDFGHWWPEGARAWHQRPRPSWRPWRPALSAGTKPVTCQDPEVRWSEGAENRQHLPKPGVEVHKCKEMLKFEAWRRVWKLDDRFHVARERANPWGQNSMS